MQPPENYYSAFPSDPTRPFHSFLYQLLLFDTHTNFTLAEVFRANAHLLSLEDAERRKTSFDTNSPLVKFLIGNLVQVYDSASDFNFCSINKLAPKWSEPRITHGEFSNSFLLCTTSGIPLKGLFHSRRL